MEENLFTLIGALKKVCEVKTGREMVFEEEKGMRKRGSFCGYRCQKQNQKAQRCCLPLYCSKYARAFGRMVVQHNTQRFCGYRNLVHILLVRAAGSGINISCWKTQANILHNKCCCACSFTYFDDILRYTLLLVAHEERLISSGGSKPEVLQF